MRQLAALLALALAGCAPRTYPECVRELSVEPSVMAIRVINTQYLRSDEGKRAVAEWAACCDLPNVYTEDTGLCEVARTSLRWGNSITP